MVHSVVLLTMPSIFYHHVGFEIWQERLLIETFVVGFFHSRMSLYNAQFLHLLACGRDDCAHSL